MNTIPGMMDAVTLTIPYPSYIPRARGIHAVGKFGTVLKAKCNTDEKESVERAADKLGISYSEFIRWVCLHAARQVLGNDHDEDRTHAEQAEPGTS